MENPKTKTDELMRLHDAAVGAQIAFLHAGCDADAFNAMADEAAALGDVQDTRAALRSALQEVVPTWRPIETAPKNGTTILIWTESPATGARRVHRVWWRMPYEAAPDDRCWWESAKPGERSSPVVPAFARGWQPLPEPPEA